MSAASTINNTSSSSQGISFTRLLCGWCPCSKRRSSQMAAILTRVPRYTGTNRDFEIELAPDREAAIATILQRIYPSTNVHQTMDDFTKGHDILWSVNADIEKSSRYPSMTIPRTLLWDNKFLVQNTYFCVDDIADTSLQVLGYHERAIKLIGGNRNESAMDLARKCIENANEIEAKVSILKTKVIALKAKVITALTDTSQKSELVEKMTSVFDNTIVYLTQTESHCKHMSSMQMNTKEKIEQSAHEWFALGRVHFTALPSIIAIMEAAEEKMTRLANEDLMQALNTYTASLARAHST